MKVSYVMFDVTNRCNFQCIHCYKENAPSGVDMDYSFIVNFLEQIKNFGQTPRVILSGGEPLIYKHLYELLDNLRDYFIRINTNAFFLDKHIDRLLKYDNLELQVSLDGYDDESFFFIRQNHNLSKVLENAVLAKKSGIKVFFRTTLTKQTLANYERFIELSKEVGIPLILRPVVYTGEECQEPLAIEYETLSKWHEECKQKDLTKYTGENIISLHCPLLRDEMVFSTLTVDAFGNVYPCMLLKSRLLCMGNINSDRYEQILGNCEDLKTKLLRLLNIPQCKECGFRKQFGDGTCAISCFLKKELCIKRYLQ